MCVQWVVEAVCSVLIPLPGLFQAYLKVHEYEKAIGDCEWALKVTAGVCL